MFAIFLMFQLWQEAKTKEKKQHPLQIVSINPFACFLSQKITVNCAWPHSENLLMIWLRKSWMRPVVQSVPSNVLLCVQADERSASGTVGGLWCEVKTHVGSSSSCSHSAAARRWGMTWWRTSWYIYKFVKSVIQNVSKSNDFANTNDKYLLAEPEIFASVSMLSENNHLYLLI